MVWIRTHVCRFGPLTDPLGMTGSLCGSQCEPTGLSQYPVFKVQAAADSLHVLRFCPPLTAQRPFGGKEIHYALAFVVSTGSFDLFPERPSRLSCTLVGQRKRPPFVLRKASSRHAVAAWRQLDRYVVDSRKKQVFNTRSGLHEVWRVRSRTLPRRGHARKCSVLPIVYTHQGEGSSAEG